MNTSVYTSLAVDSVHTLSASPFSDASGLSVIDLWSKYLISTSYVINMSNVHTLGLVSIISWQST